MTPLPRILFVDDDPQLLAGLGKALRRHRDRWTMVFAGSGAEALDEVHRAGFDVVVSDMRMPGMDGAALLTRIRAHDPTTIRMILSGFADRTAISRARPVAHQFFEKPCDLGELARAIDRACELRALLGGAGLRALIGRLGALPPAPAIYDELTGLLGQAELGVSAMAELIERDAALHARVREVLDAGLAAPTEPRGAIADTVAQVGGELVAALVVAAHALELAGERAQPGRPLAELVAHSLAVACAARALAPPAVADDAFVAGLVHDVGRIVIATGLVDADREIARQLAVPGASSVAVERAVLGATHAELGAYMLGQWGFALPIIDAVAHHHDPAAPTTPVLSALRDAHAACGASMR
jgi:putative nucleotidyltransferase with HDIG domain